MWSMQYGMDSHQWPASCIPGFRHFAKRYMYLTHVHNFFQHVPCYHDHNIFCYVLFLYIYPAPIVDINFAKPKRKQDLNQHDPRYFSQPCPSESEVDFLCDLEKIMPYSGVLTDFALRPSRSKETQEGSKLRQCVTCLDRTKTRNGLGNGSKNGSKNGSW